MTGSAPCTICHRPTTRPGGICSRHPGKRWVETQIEGLTVWIDPCNNVPMSNTQTPSCKFCGEAAHYVIGTSDETGPRATFTVKLHAGKYCLAHARIAAAEKLPAWTARRDAKRAASSESHAIWLEGFKKAQEAAK